MPVMNGLEAAPKLKELFPETPIILFTMHAEQVLATMNLACLGISAAMSKTDPFDLLLRKVSELTEAPRLN